jgi:hypothetical protein
MLSWSQILESVQLRGGVSDVMKRKLAEGSDLLNSRKQT